MLTPIPQDVNMWLRVRKIFNKWKGGENMNKEKIRLQRVLKKMSQEELAKESGVDRSYISQIESGKKTPSLSVLERIADALGCSLKDFF